MGRWGVAGGLLSGTLAKFLAERAIPLPRDLSKPIRCEVVEIRQDPEVLGTLCSSPHQINQYRLLVGRYRRGCRYRSPNIPTSNNS